MRELSPEKKSIVKSKIASIRRRHGLSKPKDRPEDSSEATQQVSQDEVVADYQESVRFWLLIYDLGRMHRSAFDAFMKPVGIDRAQWFMLALLSRQDGMGQMELADMLEIPRTRAGIVIAKLEADGWVERRDDPIDARIKRVYLVRNSQELIQQMLILAGQFSDRILLNLSASQRTDIGRSLSDIKHEIGRFNFE